METRAMGRSHDDDDDDDDVEWDDGGDGSDDEPTVPCPYCSREILEDSPRCPHCERYLSTEDTPPRRQPLWVIVTALVCLATVLWWLS